MNATVTLAVGADVVFDGEAWRVAEFDGPSVILKQAGARAVRLATSSLLATPGFSVQRASHGPEEGLGPLFDLMTADEYRHLRELESHLREVRTGYRSGSARRSLPGEPRPEYHPDLTREARIKAKAVEIGVSDRTVRRRLDNYSAEGLPGLIDGRTRAGHRRFGHVDERWIDCARDVIDEYVDASQPVRTRVFARINARVNAQHGADVKIPSESTARRVLEELTRGQDTFEGRSSKQKRSIAARPPTPYNRFDANRIGQFLLLDTSPLDVFAMDPISLTWVNTQLTIAMDLTSRCITGLRLSPISAKAVDAAMVLYETIHPGSKSHTGGGFLPYGGVPRDVIVGEGLLDGLPGVAPETIVVDHGRMYVSEHVKTVCERLGFSIQPARKYRPTDKAPVERFFLTLRRGLLNALPAYKGPDVYSRGKRTEETAYYFIDELESIIREWIVTCYHQTPHEGLKNPSLPKVAFTPAQKWEVVMAKSGVLRIPARADLVYDFLPVRWRRIQHYGVELNGLRYDGVGLNGYRDATSPYDRSDGKWPIRFDPADASRVFFQRPDDRQWCMLPWERATEASTPFSVEELQYARRLAIARDDPVDVEHALVSLLARWDAGHLTGLAERRIALRRAEQQDALLRQMLDPPGTGGEQSAGERAFSASLAAVAADGDDDADGNVLDDADYYASAWEVGE